MNVHDKGWMLMKQCLFQIDLEALTALNPHITAKHVIPTNQLELTKDNLNVTTGNINNAINRNNGEMPPPGPRNVSGTTIDIDLDSYTVAICFLGDEKLC